MFLTIVGDLTSLEELSAKFFKMKKSYRRGQKKVRHLIRKWEH